MKNGRGAPFDRSAESYDRTFTDQPIGIRKRRIVHSYLAPLLRPDWDVLELNCGTGEDAIWLSGQVRSVLATDASSGMLAVAERKGRERRVPNVDYLQLRIEELDQLSKGGHREHRPGDRQTDRYHLIFSNFDGLNCVEDLSSLPGSIRSLLHPGGDVILVLMSEICLSESLRSTLRPDRGAEPAPFPLVRSDRNGELNSVGEDDAVATWFHSPREIVRLFRQEGFELRGMRGIGVITPPTTMRHFYDRFRPLFRLTEPVEHVLGQYSPFNRLGDHTLFHFRGPGPTR